MISSHLQSRDLISAHLIPSPDPSFRLSSLSLSPSLVSNTLRPHPPFPTYPPYAHPTSTSMSMIICSKQILSFKKYSQPSKKFPFLPRTPVLFSSYFIDLPFCSRSYPPLHALHLILQRPQLLLTKKIPFRRVCIKNTRQHQNNKSNQKVRSTLIISYLASRT